MSYCSPMAGQEFHPLKSEFGTPERRNTVPECRNLVPVLLPCEVRFHQPDISVLFTYSYGKTVGSFKVLAPSGHRVVWTHPVGETKTCNFLRTRQTASAVIKHRGPSRSCQAVGPVKY